VGNGGRTDNYIWTQVLSDVMVTVPIKAGLRSRDLVVKIDPTTLTVGVKGQSPIIQGDLCDKIDATNATWTLEDDPDEGRVIALYLPKENKMHWWNCVIKGDPEINTQKIVPENSKLEDLDNDVRGTVEKMTKTVGAPHK